MVIGGMAAAWRGLARGNGGGLALAALGGAMLWRGASGHCPLYAALGIDRAQRHSPAIGVRAGHGYRIEESIVIDRPADEVFAFCRQLENLPQFMQHLVEVRPLDERRSHWVARGPFGRRLEWDAEIINLREGRLIAWRSIPGGDVDTAGSVHFQPADHQHTRLEVSLKYDPPGGKLGANLADLLGEGLEDQIRDDLRRLRERLQSAPTAAG